LKSEIQFKNPLSNSPTVLPHHLLRTQQPAGCINILTTTGADGGEDALFVELFFEFLKRKKEPIRLQPELRPNE